MASTLAAVIRHPLSPMSPKSTSFEETPRNENETILTLDSQVLSSVCQFIDQIQPGAAGGNVKSESEEENDNAGARAGGGQQMNPEMIENVNRFIQVLKRSHGDLADQLDQVVKAMAYEPSLDGQLSPAESQSVQMKPETASAIGQLVGEAASLKQQYSIDDSVTISTNDLDTVALSALRRYIDVVNCRQTGSIAEDDAASTVESNGVADSKRLADETDTETFMSFLPALKVKKKAPANARRDPPSSLAFMTDEDQKEDPPLKVTPSEEKERLGANPERNPNKQKTKVRPEEKFLRDPELHKALVVDDTGEPSRFKHRLASRLKSKGEARSDPSRRVDNTSELIMQLRGGSTEDSDSPRSDAIRHLTASSRQGPDDETTPIPPDLEPRVRGNYRQNRLPRTYDLTIDEIEKSRGGAKEPGGSSPKSGSLSPSKHGRFQSCEAAARLESDDFDARLKEVQKRYGTSPRTAETTPSKSETPSSTTSRFSARSGSRVRSPRKYDDAIASIMQRREAEQQQSQALTENPETEPVFVVNESPRAKQMNGPTPSPRADSSDDPATMREEVKVADEPVDKEVLPPAEPQSPQRKEESAVEQPTAVASPPNLPSTLQVMAVPHVPQLPKVSPSTQTSRSTNKSAPRTSTKASKTKNSVSGAPSPRKPVVDDPMSAFITHLREAEDEIVRFDVEEEVEATPTFEDDRFLNEAVKPLDSTSKRDAPTSDTTQSSRGNWSSGKTGELTEVLSNESKHSANPVPGTACTFDLLEQQFDFPRPNPTKDPELGSAPQSGKGGETKDPTRSITSNGEGSLLDLQPLPVAPDPSVVSSGRHDEENSRTSSVSLRVATQDTISLAGIEDAAAELRKGLSMISLDTKDMVLCPDPTVSILSDADGRESKGQLSPNPTASVVSDHLDEASGQLAMPSQKPPTPNDTAVDDKADPKKRASSLQCDSGATDPADIRIAHETRSSKGMDPDESSPRNREDPPEALVDASDASTGGQSCSKVGSASVLRELFLQLAEARENIDEGLPKFQLLVELAFPYFDCKTATPIDKARIQVQARRRNIPLTLTKKLIELMHTLPEQEKAFNLASGPPVETLRLMGLQERAEIFFGRLLAVKEAETRRNVCIYSVGFSYDEGAVEVDLHGDFSFTAREYAGSDSSEGSTWWESAEKLTNEAIDLTGRVDEAYPPESKEVEAVPSKQSNEPKTTERTNERVEEEINEYWEDREASRPRKSYQLKTAMAQNIPEPKGDSYSSNSFSSVSGARSYDSDEISWIRRRSMAIWPKTSTSQGWLPTRKQDNHIVFFVDKPKRIDAVSATLYFETPAFIKKRYRQPGSQQWKQPYRERTHAHSGYFNIHINSLYLASQVGNHDHHAHDLRPWEHRQVKQRFLHEQSISYSRNWFGTARKVYGNDKIYQPVCRPKSMEMPMKAGEWTEEWYTKPWPSYSDNSSAGTSERREIRRRYRGGGDDSDDDGCSWEDTPECGTFRNVKMRVGERISRVTPDLTSSLRRSRWRKKHFPNGTFPY